MVNERPDGKTDAHFGRSGALTGVKHMGREISTRGELGTDSLRSNSSGTSWLQVDRMESSEAGAAQLYGGGGGGGCGGGAGIGQEANRHGAGCEGMPEIAAVTAKAEDVQLGKLTAPASKLAMGRTAWTLATSLSWKQATPQDWARKSGLEGACTQGLSRNRRQQGWARTVT